ncbi:MAG: L,D-transpeptidase [Acidobacteriota bacterium]|nr:L,D-transpeptidase [Acidobacteriota bacterium]
MKSTTLIAAGALAALVSTAALAQQRPAQPRPAAPRPAQSTATPGAPEITDADRATMRAYTEKEALALQVTLDKEGFSPGEIDGNFGKNTLRALEAYEGAKRAKAQPAANGGLRDYTITADDVKGPFTKIPADMMEKSKLPRLGYASVAEKLGEKFHISPALLQKVNKGKRLVAGATIKVPDVDSDMTADDARPAAAPSNGGFADVTVVVSKSRSSLQVLDKSGNVIFRAPVTTGSENDPLPIGTWAVNAVARNPVFNYNPDLFWDGDPSHAKAKIPAGPNNPVGTVWIDLSKEHYGIHGTPEPGRISYGESHGCIRLTNWDALRVASLVGKGTPVLLVE